jgi:hypothetical protein
MPSDIYAKTGNGWSSAVRKIYAKTGNGWSAGARFVHAFINSGWTRVWPYSGVYATANPFISRTTSSTEINYGTVLRIGSTVRGNRGTFNPNGFTISSYQYKWVAYGYEDESDRTVYYNTALATLSGTTDDQLLSGSNYDKRWITFFVTAKASQGTTYDGSAESFRYYVVRQRPRLTVGTTPSFSNNSPAVNNVITYSSSWDTADAYLAEASRTTIKWYKNSSYSTTGGTEIQDGGYSYTVLPADFDHYIYAVETSFNSGSDYDLGQFVGVSATAITSSKVTGAVIARPGPARNVVATQTSGRPYNNAEITVTWDPPLVNPQVVDYYRIEYAYANSDGNYSGVTWNVLADEWTTRSITSSPYAANYGGSFIKWKIWSHTSAGYTLTSALSNEILTSTKAEKPVITSAVRASNTSITVRFDPLWDIGGTKGDGGSVTTYRLYAYSDDYLFSKVITTSPNTITGLTANQSYQVKIRATNNEGYVESDTVTVSLIGPPVNQTAPEISGSNRSFSLTSTGAWNPDDSDGVYGRQWKYNDQGSLYLDIPSSYSTSGSTTGATLNLNTSSLDGLGIRCYVTATNGAGPVTAYSNTLYISNPISKPTIISYAYPVLTRTSNTYDYSVTTGIWENAPTGYSYQWKAQTSLPYPPYSSTVNVGSNSSTYTSSATYLNYSIYCLVTASNSAGDAVTPASSNSIQNTAIVVAPTKLGTPGGVTATDTREDGIIISWNEVPGASYYGVWWGGQPGYDSTPDFRDINALTYHDTGAPVGSRNYYVQAFRSGNPANTKSEWGGPDSGTRAAVYVPPVVAKPGTPSITFGYSSGPTWTGSWSATGATGYFWSFYTADDSSGTNMTYRTAGTGTSMSFTGGPQYWGKVYVTASNSGGDTYGESGWA